MAARVRALDWSHTPLGPQDRWPQSLRTAVSTVLGAPFPVALWWGPSLTMVYNDAYAPLLGRKHPDALGRSGREVWAEAWPKIGSLADAVFSRRESVRRERDHFVLERNGTPEDAWFTWSYSPVTDEAGGVAGLLNIAHEETLAVRTEAARREGDARVKALTAATGAVLYRMSADWSELRPLDGKGLIASNDAPIRDWMQRNIPESEHAVLSERIAQCIAARCPFELEHRVYRPDRSVGWTRSRAVPVLDDAGEVMEWVGTAEDVTERQQWIVTLAETRRKLDSALIAGEVGTFEWDVISDRLWGDHNFERIFGITLDASGAAPLATYVAAIHPADRDRVLQRLQQSLATGCDYEAEYRVRTSVPPRWVIARGKVERDWTGRVIRFPGVVLDETERKEAELLLSAQNRALQLVAAAAPVTEALGVLTRAVEDQYDGNAFAAILLVDADGCTLRTGAAPSLPPDYCAAIDGIKAKPDLGTCADAAARNEVVVTPDIEAAPSWRGLSHLPLGLGLKAAWSMPIRASDGRVLGTFGTYFRECREPSARERHIVESLCFAAALAVERRRADEALRESEARYRRLVETAHEGVWTIDKGGRTTYVNQRMADLLGYAPEEMMGRVHTDFMWEQDRPKGDAEMDRRRQGMAAVWDQRYRRKDGSELWTVASCNTLYDADGKFAGALGMFTDITGRKRAEAERQALLDSEQAARAEADAANRAKDRFLAVLSHELRTPLTPVALTAAAMELDPALPYEFREGVAMIRRNVELETRLIDDLLDLSRVISGKLRLNPQPTHAHHVIRHVLETVGAELHEKRLKVEAELTAVNDLVNVDAARFQQTLWNLLKNAAKFTPQGGGIFIRTGNESEQLVVEVSDTGKGIAADVLPRIFDPFEQGDAEVTRRYGGMGLGLAIAKAVVDLHGGTLNASSDGDGKGATFSVSLPLCADASPAIAALGGEAHNAQTRPLRLLLVEDHADTANTLVRLLRLDGMNVQWAGTVAAAVELASSEPFDVVVSDLGLPDGSGHELIRRLLRERPIIGIAMSGYGMEDDIRQSREAGFVEHLVKPVSLPQLRETIRRVASTIGR